MADQQNTIASIDLSEYNFDQSSLSGEDLIRDFTCLICYGVALKPKKCNKCEAVYCSKCLPKGVTPDGTIKTYSGSYKCFKQCGSS